MEISSSSLSSFMSQFIKWQTKRDKAEDGAKNVYCRSTIKRLRSDKVKRYSSSFLLSFPTTNSSQRASRLAARSLDINILSCSYSAFRFAQTFLQTFNVLLLLLSENFFLLFCWSIKLLEKSFRNLSQFELCSHWHIMLSFMLMYKPELFKMCSALLQKTTLSLWLFSTKTLGRELSDKATTLEHSSAIYFNEKPFLGSLNSVALYVSARDNLYSFTVSRRVECESDRVA